MNTNVVLHPTKRAMVIHDSPMVRNTIRTASPLARSNKHYLMVPHRPLETILMRRLGFDVPAPILTHYDWNGVTPFQSQMITAGMMTTERRAYVLNGMGTGKTLAALFALDYLMREAMINRALVIAPLSTLTTVWVNEVFRYMNHRTAVALHGDRRKRLRLLDMDHNIYIINHDGVSTILPQLMERGDINAVVIDELTAFRNKQSIRWKRVNALCKEKRFVWGMTGSPTPKEPLDAYGQIKLITPKNGPSTKTQFQRDTMYQVSTFRWIPRKGANEYVHEHMQPSVRFSIEDCMDLPPTTYTTLSVAMTKAQKETYKQMKDHFVAKLESGDIEASNSGVQASKLLQIGCGFVYDEKGKAHNIDSGERIKILHNTIFEAARKVIVFAPFRHTVQEVYESIVKAGWTAGVIHGGVTALQRNQIFEAFQNGRDPQVLVAHPKTMSHGLTLTTANTIVWYAPLPDLEIYEQANARIVRPSQKYSTNIVHIEGNHIEKRIYKVLRDRGDAQKELLNIFHEVTRKGLQL